MLISFNIIPNKYYICAVLMEIFYFLIFLKILLKFLK